MADDQFEGSEHRDLVARLQRMGQEPVDPAVARRHLSAMVALPERRGRFSRKAVALAAVVGFLAGSTGLAAAGALPGPAQDVAHDVFGAVGIGVPRSTEGCPEGQTYKNHGQYVSEVEAQGGDVNAAAKSSCGKPVKGAKGANGAKGSAREQGKSGDRGQSGTAPGARPDTDGDPCTGPPPWAGTKVSKEERAALQEQHRLQCPGADETGDADELETESEADEAGDESTSTTTEDTSPDTSATTDTTEATTSTETTDTTGG